MKHKTFAEIKQWDFLYKLFKLNEMGEFTDVKAYQVKKIKHFPGGTIDIVAEDIGERQPSLRTFDLIIKDNEISKTYRYPFLTYPPSNEDYKMLSTAKNIFKKNMVTKKYFFTARQINEILYGPYGNIR